MAIRRAVPADAGVVARLLADFNAEFATSCPPVGELTRRLRRLLGLADMMVWLSGEPGAYAGFALVTLRPTTYADGPLPVLDELYVVPQQRGRGLGHELMGAVERDLAERECAELHITVDEEDEDTRRFYVSLGYRNHEPGEDSRFLLYLKDL